jgi:SecD/SecF fusion protein
MKNSPQHTSEGRAARAPDNAIGQKIRGSRSSPLRMAGLLILLASVGGTSCTRKAPAHGASFLLEMGLAPELATTPESKADTLLADTQAQLKKRLDKLGFKPVFEPVGTNRLVIKLAPGSPDRLDLARRMISSNAILEFRFVHPDNESQLKTGLVPPGYEIMEELRVNLLGGEKTKVPFLVEKKPVPSVSGGNILRASVTRDPIGQPQILFNLDPSGAKAFGELTSQNVGRQLAILLNGQIQSAPVIRSPITGGSAVIQANFSDKEAFDLASLLESWLPAPVKLIEERHY